MDGSAMFPTSYNPVYPFMNRENTKVAKYYTRTQRPPKYHLIDFGLSRRYNPECMPPLEDIILGGDKSPPEHNGSKYPTACNPFPTDIYYLGNMMRSAFLEVFFRLLPSCKCLLYNVGMLPILAQIWLRVFAPSDGSHDVRGSV